MPEQIVFRNSASFREWLRSNHGRPKGLWLIFSKKDSIKTLTPEEALEEALCFGWIDGIVKRVDEAKYVKFFSPRRPKSKWSERNKKIAEMLIQSGRMASPGRDAIERAKQDETWEGERRLVVTTEDINRLAGLVASNSRAAINFKKMPPSAKKLFTGFYLDAKQDDTRKRRLAKITQMLEENKKPLM